MVAKQQIYVECWAFLSRLSVIPSATTKHEQVPASTTKKHNASMCYRPGTANVGGSEMVLGRISQQQGKSTIDGFSVRADKVERSQSFNLAHLADLNMSIDDYLLLPTFPTRFIALSGGFHRGISVEPRLNVSRGGFRVKAK